MSQDPFRDTRGSGSLGDINLSHPPHPETLPGRGEKKREIPEWTPGKIRSCKKTTSERRRSAHALKGWGAVSGPPCAGRLSPKEYEPVRRYRSGRKSKKVIRGNNKKGEVRKVKEVIRGDNKE